MAALASAATAVTGSVIGKLTTMLNDKYQLARNVKRGIRFLRDELSTMEAVLLKLEDKDDDQIDPLAKDWRSKVRELSYDIEDCIDRFVLNHSQRGSNPNFVKKAVRKVKMLFKDGGIAEEIQELKRLVSEQSEQGKRYMDINQCLPDPPQPVLLDPRAHALFQDARDLVGIDAPREEIISLLNCEEQQHKVVSIYGIGGQGKTTLAMEVYNKISGPFDCRAFVSVSQTPDMKKLLRDLLSQISKSEFCQSESLEIEQLSRRVKEFLKDKRYLILIDDIWKENAWNNVLCALPLSNNGSRIITTTRKKDVAKLCCNGIETQMYEAKPLSDDNSQRLFFKRVFGHCEAEACPQELGKVSGDILRKCGGLPLAIISIAGLLANRSQTVEVFVDVLRSIAAAVHKDSPLDKMKRILLLSYYDLPHHLKSCLLYLSVFPEDHLIDCQQLILLWVAEGMIPGQDRETMEQLGKSYLNELINRSLVQPTKVGVSGTTMKKCRVHDVILEFIVSKAVEDNFVTIWNGNVFSENYSSSNKIRRLSIQKDISARADEIAKILENTAHIRSITTFGPSDSTMFNKHASKFLNNQVLRVVNTTHAYEELSLGQIKSLGQLKYLRIPGRLLPEGIEKLQRLEALHVEHVIDMECRDLNLPTCIMELSNLVRLSVHQWLQLPDGIRNLQALEELSDIDLGRQSVKFIEGLGDLEKLRVLEIFCPRSLKFLGKKACISSLSKLLTHLRELHLRGYDPEDILMDLYVPTAPPLQKLVLNTSNLNRVGPQISSLVNLTRLSIFVVSEAGKEEINILTSLPMLLSLTIHLFTDRDSKTPYCSSRHTVRGQGFQRLVKFTLRCWREDALEFEPGAMPKLQRLKLRLFARCQFQFGNDGVVLGLQNLGVGLKHVAIEVYCEAAVGEEVEALEKDIRVAAAVHPNRPTLQIVRTFQDHMAQGCSRRPSDHANMP